MNSMTSGSEAWVSPIRGLQGYDASLPKNLPPDLPWTVELVGTLSAADRAIGQLAGSARNLPNPRLLIRSFINREAVLSSKIEGTRTTLADLLLFEVDQDVESRVPDVREVANYVRALDHGLEMLRRIPLTLNLIKDLHRILLTGVRGSEQHPGEFRRCQNFIGTSQNIAEATYVPPPSESLPGLLHALEVFINTPSEIPLLVRLAMIHYQFEAIHPFEDGNGRVGRLLMSLLMESEQALPHPVLYLSAYFEKNRDRYYELLLNVSKRGEWSAWVQFFLRGVAEQSIDAVERAQSLFELRGRWMALLQTARTSALLTKLIDELFIHPYVNLGLVKSYLDVTSQSAQNSINQLLRQGILTEITGRQRNRIYAARDILRVLDQTAHLTTGS